VLFFSGLSFAGYVARRAVGPGHGYFVTGLLGGLVSSTNVTFTFARTSRAEPAHARALALGAIAANAMLYPRVLIATTVLNAAVAGPLLPYLTLPALIALVVAAAGAYRSNGAAPPEPDASNPLQLKAALQMAVLFQAVLMAVYAARELGGASGIFTSAAVLGLTDVDALTVSMTREVAPTTSPAIAAAAIAVGILSNTGMKCVLAAMLGSRQFRLRAGGALLVMFVAAGAAVAILAFGSFEPFGWSGPFGPSGSSGSGWFGR
jgi:uncharacterized membrane protein (DUF4010 family)